MLVHALVYNVSSAYGENVEPNPSLAFSYNTENDEIQMVSTNDQIADKWQARLEAKTTFWAKTVDKTKNNILSTLDSGSIKNSGFVALPENDEGEMEYYEALSSMSGAKKRNFKARSKDPQKFVPPGK